MDSPGGSTRDTSSCASSRLPHHLQQPSSSSCFSDPEVFPSTQHIRPGQAFVSVQTLTKESFHIAVNAKTKVHDVLWKCGERLSLSEDKLFGLAFRQPTEGIGGDQPRHEYYFLDPAAKIMKYAHKQPRFTNWHSRSSENRPILVLYFRVRVYIDQVGLLTCPKAREHYYLQLKDNFLDHWAGSHSVSEERCWYMAALALITDKGTDYLGYFRAEQYFPLWVINERGLEYIRNNLPAACEDIINEGRDKAMEKFMIEAGRSPFALNCHLYGLRRHKMDNVDNAVLGINARGIEMCDIGENGDRIPLRALQWNRVTRLSFDRKKLTIIGADGTKMSLYAQTESKAKYLLELCRAVHQTLLVMSHLYATMAPPPKPYQEMSVDGISTSSTSGIGSGDHDKDSDSLSSVCGDRCHGSVSSKLRLRIKMDSNLDVKIEKMELEHIRQERAASQSSKASDESDRSRQEIRHQTYHPANESSGATSSTHTVTTHDTATTTTRPSSIDNASQTVETSSTRSIVDLNFNKRGVETTTFTTPPLSAASTPPKPAHIAFSSCGQSSLDVLDNRNDPGSYSPTGQWQPIGSSSPPQKMTNQMTRSETRIDAAEMAMNFEIWAKQALDGQTMGPNSQGGRFLKKNSAGSRTANTINRVHSMPSHYHASCYKGPSQISAYDEVPVYTNGGVTNGGVTLTHAHSLHVPNSNSTAARPRNPPPYEFPKMSAQQQCPPPLPTGPLPAEAACGQPAFPPASATPTQFIVTNSSDEDGFSTENYQNYPFLMQLWKEHRMSMGQLNSIGQTVLGQNGYGAQQIMPTLTTPKGHNRRPSSCNDLSTIEGIGAICTPILTNGLPPQRSSDFYFDSAAIQQNMNQNPKFGMIPSTIGPNVPISTTTTMNAPILNGSTTAKNGHMILKTTHFTKVENHNGNIHLPPPPPYQQPQQLVN